MENFPSGIFIPHYMKRHIIYFILVAGALAACSEKHASDNPLSEARQQDYLLKMAPFVNKKHKKASFEDRFLPEYKSFYQMLLEETSAELRYYHREDEKHYFLYNAQDRTSLYEHYRAQGGFFKVDENDSIVYMEVFFYTPRLTAAEMKIRGKELFEEMVVKGNIDRFVGNTDYIKVPNADFYYETSTNTWEYTEHSSWNFLKEAREESQQRLEEAADM
jgi:hypothetical protein